MKRGPKECKEKKLGLKSFIRCLINKIQLESFFKFEIEKYLSITNNTFDKFKRKWAINCNLLFKI